MGYSIQELSEETAEAWDEFNNQCPEGTFFHSIKWKKILENVIHIDPKYWIISSGQKIVGIVPSKKCTLTYLKGLDTLPHSEFNSILLDNNFDPRDLHEVLTQFASKYSFFS